jgi:hypothetical protein
MAEREAHILFVMASLNKERKERSALVISSDQHFTILASHNPIESSQIMTKGNV